jgi:hypothetical protein
MVHSELFILLATGKIHLTRKPLIIALYNEENYIGSVITGLDGESLRFLSIQKSVITKRDNFTKYMLDCLYRYVQELNKRKKRNPTSQQITKITTTMATKKMENILLKSNFVWVDDWLTSQVQKKKEYQYKQEFNAAHRFIVVRR